MLVRKRGKRNLQKEGHAIKSRKERDAHKKNKR
jgi:hypothetical protein